MRIPPREAVDAALARTSLREFVRQAWPHVPHLNGVTYVENWHVAAICEHLEAVARGQLRYLLINQPPRSTKTELTGVFLPAWIWTWNPSYSAIFSSLVANASNETSVRCRSLLESDWYRAHHAHGWVLREDKNAKNDFANTRGGSRLATSLDAAVIGKGADLIVGDDLESDKTVQTETGRKNARVYWDGTLSSRARRASTVAKILVQQRLHVKDLSAHLLASGLYTHLYIPAEYNPRRSCVTVVASREWRDPRTQEGELLNPLCEPLEIAERTVAEQKTYGTGVGPVGFGTQYNQDPKVEQGGAAKRLWWNWYTDRRWSSGGRPEGCATAEERPAVKLPRDLELTYVQSVDTAVKAKVKSDATCAGVGAHERSGARVFVRDVEHDRVSIRGMIPLILRQRERFAKCRTTYVEDKSSGSDVVDLIAPEVTGVIAVDPGNVSKEDRFRLNTLPRLEAGQVYLPEGAPWLEYLVGEHADFPGGEHDDSVDMLSQMLSKIQVVSVDLAFARSMSKW